jgi:hypothetical protein
MDGAMMSDDAVHASLGMSRDRSAEPDYSRSCGYIEHSRVFGRGGAFSAAVRS